MASQLTNPFLYQTREGSLEDPYVDKVEVIALVSGRAILQEVPVKEFGIVVDGYVEKSTNTPTGNDFYVDYGYGVVYFDPSATGTVTVRYKGKGVVLVPSDRIYHADSKTNETLGVTLNRLSDLEETFDEKLETTTQAALLANAKASFANEQGEYALAQGGYASAQGDYAKAMGLEAKGTAEAAVGSALSARDEALAKAQLADEAARTAKVDWLDPVQTFADLATTYPNPIETNQVQVLDTGYIYRFKNGLWDSHLFSPAHPQNMARHTDRFIATQGQTVFNTTKPYFTNQDRIDVYVSGVKQASGIDFNETSPTRITLTTGCEVGEIVETVYLKTTEAQALDLIEQVQAAEAATVAANTAKEEALSAATSTKLIWKDPVASFAALSTTYPTAVFGWTAATRDNGRIFRFDGTSWRWIQDVDMTAYNALDTKLTSQLAENAKDLKLKKDGTDVVPDITSFVSSLGTNKATIIITNGIYDIKSNVTIPTNVDILFRKGGQLRVTTGATLTIKGNILAGNQEIFVDAGGNVDLQLSPNEYNLGWFQSGAGYINERWDFAKRSMVTFVKKIIRFPKPYDGQPGTEKTGSRMFWLFNGEIKIQDEHNTSTYYVDAEFKAAANTTNFLNFDDASKPESMFFYGDFQVLVPPAINVGCAINIKSAARITFWGNVVINGARTAVKCGSPDQVAAVGDIRFFQLQCSFFYETAVLIYGKAVHTTQAIQIDRLTVTAAQSTGLNALEIKGLIRNIKIGDVTYATDVAKNGYLANDAENVVLIESNGEGAILKVDIDNVYQANANNAVKIATNATTPQGIDKIQYVKVKNIFAKFNGSAATIADCVGVEIESVHNSSDVTVNSTANYVWLKVGRGVRTITDNGNYTVINSIGKQTRGGGVPPSPSIDWPVGCMIRETSDGKVYVRIAKAGLASDFVALN